MIGDGPLNYKHLRLVNETLDFMSEDGLSMLEKNYDDFINSLQVKGLKADATWQEVVCGCLFRREARKIEDFI